MSVMTKCVCVALCGAFWLSAAHAAEAARPIDAAEAGRIALQYTGGGQVLEIDQHNRGRGMPYFRVEVQAPDGRYHIVIDAATGGMVKFVRKGGGVAMPSQPGVQEGGLSYEQALQLAMAQTGGGTVVESDVDRKWSGRVEYEFEIVNNGVKYEIEIDGSSGAILQFKQKGMKGYAPLPATPAPQAAPATPPVVITPAPQAAPGLPRLDAPAAQALARERAGGGTVTKYETDWDDGRLVHEITLMHEGTRYKMEIDDATGEVVEYSLKR